MEVQTVFTDDDIKLVARARSERNQHPSGHFQRNGFWLPSEAELCGRKLLPVKYPTHQFPMSFNTHCRTYKHCRYIAEHNPAYFAECLAHARKVYRLPPHRQMTIL